MAMELLVHGGFGQREGTGEMSADEEIMRLASSASHIHMPTGRVGNVVFQIHARLSCGISISGVLKAGRTPSELGSKRKCRQNTPQGKINLPAIVPQPRYSRNDMCDSLQAATAQASLHDPSPALERQN